MNNINYKGIDINIMIDDSPMNPREEFDNFGNMVCFHNRYSLGDYNEFDTPVELETFLEEEKGRIVVLPLYLIDHSGLVIQTTSFNDPWDSGKVGYIYAHIGKESITDTEKIKEILISEVEMYSQFLSGDTYGYVIKTEGFEDSCWDYFGSDFENNGLLDNARNSIDYHLKEKAIRDHKERMRAVKIIKSAKAFRKRKKAVREL